LLKINEEIDSFVYSASHDLKSPILNIEALLKILNDIEGDEPEFEKSIKDKLVFSVEKMKKTINHLAEVAKAQKELYDDVGPVKFEEVLYDLIKENEEIIKIEDVQLEYNFKLADTIICSKTCLKSIMYNFLTNSIKYKDPSRSPVIKFYSEQGNDFVKLVVNDNGLGIDLQKNGAKLFSLFKRFHDHVEGAGIGLYTVKKMVEKYNGDIDVESEPGRGTTFMVRFKSIPGKEPISF
jgi:signal transduction histidine kinase